MTAVQQIDRFVRDLGTTHRHQVLRQALVRWSLVLGVALLLLHWIVPGLLLGTLATALVTLGLVAACAFARGGLNVGALDRRLQLQDRLTTWQLLASGDKPTATPMSAWLAADLAGQLDGMDELRAHAAVARRVGSWRYLLPVLILLFLVHLLENDPPPPPPPAAGGIGEPGPGGSGGGAGGVDSTQPSQPQPAQEVQAPPADAESELPPPPAAPVLLPPLEGPPPPPEEANPIPDLDVRDEFSVPHFVGEGETRRQLARQARVSESNPPPGAAERSRPEEQLQEPEPTDFERAYERALQSRHVPEHERAFLARYFRVLREGSR